MVGRASDRTAEQMGNAVLGNFVGGPTYRIQDAIGFDVFVDVRRGEIVRSRVKGQLNNPKTIGLISSGIYVQLGVQAPCTNFVPHRLGITLSCSGPRCPCRKYFLLRAPH